MQISDIISNINIYGLESSIKASKYPMSTDTSLVTEEITSTTIKLGNADKGSGHDVFLTGIVIQFDLTLTNKCWVEAERYHFLEFVSSQSSMHKISKFDLNKQYIEYVDQRMIDIMNELKDRYNQTKDIQDYLKLLYSNPCGFRLTARMTTNYRQLKTIYSQRKTHRLPEWRLVCEWIESLPMFDVMCLGRYAEDKLVSKIV